MTSTSTGKRYRHVNIRVIIIHSTARVLSPASATVSLITTRARPYLHTSRTPLGKRKSPSDVVHVTWSRAFCKNVTVGRLRSPSDFAINYVKRGRPENERLKTAPLVSIFLIIPSHKLLYHKID